MHASRLCWVLSSSWKRDLPLYRLAQCTVAAIDCILLSSLSAQRVFIRACNCFLEEGE